MADIKLLGIAASAARLPVEAGGVWYVESGLGLIVLVGEPGLVGHHGQVLHFLWVELHHLGVGGAIAPVEVLGGLRLQEL